ncbi:MAG: hypothetical protein K0R68_1038 [Mycobacterium sp.]|nr:hypothetical protein [Mycobacterium sp.]
MRLLSSDARHAIFAPLGDPGRAEAVVRRLGSAIAMGIIADGEQLPSETQLAASLNVSTVTLREALSDLRARGLLETRRGRGGGSFVRASDGALTSLSHARLRELGSADLREFGDVRIAISGTAARLAAERASGLEIERLRSGLQRLGAAVSAVEHRRIEGRYYIDVAAIAQSVRLTRHEIDLQAEMGQLLWGTELAEQDRATATKGHEQVVDAIERRDAELARKLTEERIIETTSRLIAVHVRLTREADTADSHSVPSDPPPEDRAAAHEDGR